MITQWSFPTKILFGEGALSQLGDKLAECRIARPLVVVDKGIVQSGLCDRLVAVLKKAGIAHAIFDGVDPNPVEQNVERGLEAYRGSTCDGIVAMGGGSPMDAGKIIRLRVTHSRPLEEYDDLRDGWRLVTADVPPMIAIPTTAGTGSEVGRSGVVILRSNKRKTVIFSPHLMPTWAVIDPELTVGLPPRTTAATGLDALTHGIEAYCAKGYHPMADGVALECVKLAARFLPRAVADGKDIEARRNMMAAAMMGAVAFQKGLGACHALAHPLSSEAGLHHGLSNALMLPHVMRFNLDAARDRLADVALAMGASPGAPDLAERAAAEVERLCAACGLPSKLGQCGVSRDQAGALAAKAIDDGCHQSNPRPVTAGDLEALYLAAF